MKLYRAMKPSEDGLPEVGRSARKLGVRTPREAANPDVPAKADDEIIRPGTGGMSVAPDEPANLPPMRRPTELGGTGKDPVWEIDTADLSLDLQFRQDKLTHGLIEPASEMPLSEFETALAATRTKWRRVVG